MTQETIADEFRISVQAVSQWEDDKAPAKDKLPRLAQLLKVPLMWLMEGRGAPPSPDDPQVLIEGFTQEEKAAAAKYIQFLRSDKRGAA